MRRPKFGDRLLGIWASATNPAREGTYVETVQLQRRPHYRITDERGAFWYSSPEGVVFVDEGPWTEEQLERLRDQQRPARGLPSRAHPQPQEGEDG